MRLEDKVEMGGCGREKARYNSTTGAKELTRDDRRWREIIANSIPDVKEEYEHESTRGKDGGQ
jgi:hypothetical protein